MEQIDTLSSIKGRALLAEIFKELRYRRQYNAFNTLVHCWKICVHEKDLTHYLNRKISVLHPLGFFRGMGLWMEEIVNRFYFSSINSFVYFGAAILLLLIGVRKFSDHISDTAIIAALSFEALLLFFMFIVMFFTPKDDFSEESEENERETTAELLMEVGEVAKDLAGALIQMERINENFMLIASNQQKTNETLESLIESINHIAISTADAVSPNPQMLDAMKQTNQALMDLNQTVVDLNSAAKKINREEIETAVKRELERIIANKIG